MSQNVNVNLTPGGYPKEFHVSQYDVGRQLVAKVVDSTGDYSIPSGATVVLVGTKPSGFGFTLNGTVSGSTVTFSTTATVTAEYGRIPCEIRITNGSTILGTANCMLVVEMSPHQEDTVDGDSATVIPELTLLVERIEAAAESIHDLSVSATTLAAGSDATANYDAEENSINFGIPRGADGEVSQAELDAAVSDLKSDLKVEQDDGLYHRYLTWEHGGIDNATGLNNNEGSLVRSRMPEYLLCSDYVKIINDSVGWVYVIFYDSDKTFTGSMGIAAGSYLNIPTDQTYFRIDLRLSIESTRLVKAYQLSATKALEVSLKEKKPQASKGKYSSIFTNEAKSLSVVDCLRKGARLQFVGEIASFGFIEIGYSTSANGGGTKYNRFNVSANTIQAYTYYDYNNSAMHTESVTHDLNITNGNVSVIIEELPQAQCKLTIINNGNSYSYIFDGWVRNNVLRPYFIASYSAFTNVTFSWSCTDLSKDIWLFGDSYMAYEDVRWTYYLEQYGYASNVLINAFPGCWSGAALTSLNSLINYGTPEYIVWGLGMNDGSDSTSEPVASWVNARDLFIAKCNANNITPVFCTIPTVPTVNNEKKNEWVRTSGYKYIDFAKAVLANSNGAWGSGMLSSDGVHPTIQGAKMLFAQALTDFPELMVSD